METIVIMLTVMLLVTMGVVYWLAYKVTSLQSKLNGLVKDCEIIVDHVDMCERALKDIISAMSEEEQQDVMNKLFYHGPVGEA